MSVVVSFWHPPCAVVWVSDSRVAAAAGYCSDCCSGCCSGCCCWLDGWLAGAMSIWALLHWAHKCMKINTFNRNSKFKLNENAENIY